MKTENRLIRKRNHPTLRLPREKSGFFNENTDIYLPVMPERKQNKKEFTFVVDWQMTDK